ncbi:MAG: flagellar hook protein FlgE [Myxococcota bacterium]|nr:flagellar hook protein FlgE [Myxococcota bacterium]
MSLFSTMNTATSGLGAASSRMGVIGDNIANLNTTGFKGSRAEFADFLPQDVFGLAGPSQLGKGAALNGISTLHQQGSIDQSTNALDMAISGNGFFVVNDGVQDFYSRNGTFFLDEDGFVVNTQELNLQGYNATDGVLGATVEDLQLDLDPIAPDATTTITMTANLSAEADFSTTPVASLTFDGNTDTLEDAADQADFATSITVYDSLGTPHQVTVVFERTATGDWSYYSLVDASEVTSTSLPTGGAEGNAFQIASGTVSFDTDGNLTSISETLTSASDPWSFTGASSQDLTLEFGIDTAGVATDGRLRQHNGDSNVSAVAQDGFPTGNLTSLSVDSDGIIYGEYTNGEEFVMGQVVLAKFPSNGGLERVGNTLFRATLDSGAPAVGAPDTGGRGVVAGNALEKSNVDLEDEFVSMITAQRTFQANARVINTSNDTLQELVNLV